MKPVLSGVETARAKTPAIRLFRMKLSHNRDVAKAITKDPATMHGTPVFRGKRVPVQNLFDYIEAGESLEDFLEGFPTVSHSFALEAFEEAKHLLLARA